MAETHRHDRATNAVCPGVTCSNEFGRSFRDAVRPGQGHPDVARGEPIPPPLRRILLDEENQIVTLRACAGRCILPLSIITSLAAALAEPVAAARVPNGGVGEVTGYERVVPVGSFGAITVLVRGTKAAAIRSALAGLTIPYTGPTCLEDDSAFQISLLPEEGARPTDVATEEECPSPGIVLISAAGTRAQPLREDCALRAAVIAALPPGLAEATRRDRNSCST